MKGLSRGLLNTLTVFLFVFLFLWSGPGVKQAAAEDKIYDNKEVGFTVKYPSDWLADTLQPTEVLRVHNPNEGKVPVLTVSVVDLVGGARLEDMADAWVVVVKNAIPGTDGFKVTSNEIVKLEDGTTASAYIIEWTWLDGKTQLVSVNVTAFNRKKIVTVQATNVLGEETPPDVLMDMCRTLKFY